mmetsp:Transcript_3582/g.8558  ORF Transcript_3582/g.8558 Transcript_3582/m.8558 type:complete len:204 (+) Transcript_3582:488-1099(+)
MRLRSSGSSGLWSTERRTALPSRHSTARASPQLATNRSLPTNTVTSAVVPLSYFLSMICCDSALNVDLSAFSTVSSAHALYSVSVRCVAAYSAADEPRWPSNTATMPMSRLMRLRFDLSERQSRLAAAFVCMTIVSSCDGRRPRISDQLTSKCLRSVDEKRDISVRRCTFAGSWSYASRLPSSASSARSGGSAASAGNLPISQ